MRLPISLPLYLYLVPFSIETFDIQECRGLEI